ncbi:MAG: membrane protein insertase YidC [Opitutales bacterium]|nr:membrane protein insertase YidC [Opitutales bacterium]
MDKKNTIIGVLLIIAAFYFMFDSSKKEAEAAKAQRAVATKTVQAKPVDLAKQLKSSPITQTTTVAKEEFFTLKNENISVRFTSKGGAINDVEILKYLDRQDSKNPFTFNKVNGALPAMTMAFFDSSSDLPMPMQTNFALVAKSNEAVTYEYVQAGKFKISRTYALIQSGKNDFTKYTIASKTKIENISGKALPLEEVYFCLGAVPPTESDVYGSNLAFLMYDGDDAHFSRSSSFIDSSGFLGIGSSRAQPYEKITVGECTWGSVKNQFFASVFTPENAKSNIGIAIPLATEFKSDNKYMKNSIAGFMGFAIGTLDAGKSWELAGSFYVGPKELDALASLGAGQEEVMNYGWFGFVSRPLSRLLVWINSLVETVSPDWSWGWSIIILTLIVRGILWPLTSVQIKSAQRMAKLQEPLKAIKEKYKDDPKRVQQETMKIYSEYGINPLAGCLPVLIQIPIFIGLYYMLQTSCEIRFAHFLWINDLSLPDTIESLPSIFGIPLHILPLLNAGVTFFQMHLTPSPSTDKTQAMMLKLMPVIMLVFFYTFPSGLILYWLVQSLLGILQALIIRMGKDKVVLKKRTTPTFMQKMQMAMEQAQQAQEKRGADFAKLPLKERLRIAAEDARKAKEKIKNDRLKGTMYEKRKKNPGGRSTPKKKR